jgi:hypothetical protein
MALMNRLEAYLALERAMLRLDAAGDVFADVLRESMDPLWYELSTEDREFLNRRHIPEALNELEPLHGVLARMEPPRRVEGYQERAPVHIQNSDWMRAE